MIFLEENDFISQIKADNLTAIVSSETGVLEVAEANAIATVTTYLYDRYDTENIFTQTGLDRVQIVVNMCVKLMLYELYCRLPKLKIPEARAEEKRETITLLERIGDAKQSIPAPRKLDAEEQAKTQFKWGSSTRRTY